MISIPQQNLYNILRMIFPDAIQEYPIKANKENELDWSRTKKADIAIPSLKIDFEYDGWPHYNHAYYDYSRDECLKLRGWETIRVNKKILSVLMMNLSWFNYSNQDRFLNFIKKAIIMNKRGEI